MDIEFIVNFEQIVMAFKKFSMSFRVRLVVL
jgi:hypothetical protein